MTKGAREKSLLEVLELIPAGRWWAPTVLASLVQIDADNFSQIRVLADMGLLEQRDSPHRRGRFEYRRHVAEGA